MPSKLIRFGCIFICFTAMFLSAGPASAVVVYSFPDFTNISGLTFNGSAATINSDGPIFYNEQFVLRMTDGGDQGSSVFITSPVRLDESGGSSPSFSASFSFQTTYADGGEDDDGPGGDGIMFVIQSKSQNAIGVKGDGLGYAGIPNSIGIEFDTFYNPENQDRDGNHIGINIGGSVISIGSASVSNRLNDGSVWYAWVEYDGSRKLLEVRLSETKDRPKTAALTYNIDLAAVLNTSQAYIGFTAGTAAAWGDQDIRSFSFVNLYSAGGEQSTGARKDDFNGDGIGDILWRNISTGQVYIWLLKSDGSIASDGSPGTVDLSWEIKKVNDFNNDGKSDILWRNNKSGQVIIWFINGLSISSHKEVSTLTDMNWKIQ